MMNATTVSALAGVLGVVAGALISSAGVMLREQKLRKQQLADRWAEFQRESILGLQDAIGELWSQAANAYNQAAKHHRITGRWPKPSLAKLPEFNRISQRIQALRARVFDDSLRRLSDDVMKEVWAVFEEGDWKRQPDHMEAALVPKHQFHDKVNSLLKDLAKPPS